MYSWGLGINGRVCFGRTWFEFVNAINILHNIYNLSIEKRLVIYVHNLAYEFQWIKNLFKWHTVFAIDSRKPIYAVTENGIEFRCSYLLSGFSLESLGKNLTKYKCRKLVGSVDYSLIRHSNTELTDDDYLYLESDVLIVMAHVQEEIERLGSIKYIPLTKTGYVRNECRERCLKGHYRFEYSRYISHLTMTVDDYHQLKRAFSGGFTHANINYVNRTVSNVDSYDFTSSYPAVMLSEQFPMSKAIPTEVNSEEELLHYLKHFCCIFDVTFINIRSTVNFENYISRSRCYECEHPVLNNGRLVEAERISLTITEQDFFIISKMYEWDEVLISNFKRYYRAYLPKPIVEMILDLYESKTTLKGVEEALVEYMVSKGMINAMYGMTVTDPCRDENIYDDDADEWTIKRDDEEKLIEKYNKSRTRFLYYPWGVWVTAYARANLFTGILEFKDDYVYADTDSIKVVNTYRHRKYFEKYNNTIISKIRECLKHHELPISRISPKTIKGVEKPLGVWDYEHTYSRFKTLGAKRYMVELDGKIEITIAGVNKTSGIKFLYNTFKTNNKIFANFKENLEFPAHYNNNGDDTNASGKMLHTYIDEHITGIVIDYQGLQYEYEEWSCIHLENTAYCLSLESEFIKMIMGMQLTHISRR